MADDIEDLDGTGVMGGQPDESEGREPIAPDPAMEAPSTDFPIKLPDDFPSEQVLLEWSEKRKKEHATWFGTNNGYGEQMLNSWKAYDSKPLPGQGALACIPLSNSIIETDTAKTYQSLFSRSKWVDAQPLTPQPDNENKTTVEDLINQELLYGRMGTARKCFDILKGLGIEGTGAVRLEWAAYEEETINVPVDVTNSLTGETSAVKATAQSKVFVTRHAPDLTGEAMQNLVWDPRVQTCLQDSEYVCHRQFPDLTTLLIMQQQGKLQNVDKIKRIAEGSSPRISDPDQKRRDDLAPSGAAAGNKGISGDSHRLDEWWGNVPYKSEDDGTWKTVWLHWMIVNEEVLVLCEPDPWKDESGHGPGHPFISFHKMIHPRDLLGSSVLQPIMDLQMYANGIQDSMSKLTKKAAKHPTFVTRAAGVDIMRMFQDELSIVPVLDANGIVSHPIDGPQLKAVAEERAWAIQQALQTVAANENVQGVATQNIGNATATEASIINANSGTRFQFNVDQLSYEFCAPLANGIWWMIRQWSQDGDLVVRESSIDGNSRPVTRDMLVNDYYFTPVTSALVNQQRALLQQKMQFVEQMIQLQSTNPEAMKNPEGEQYYFDAIDFIVNEIFPLMGIRNGRTYLSKFMAQQGIPMGASAAAALGIGKPGQPGIKPGASGAPQAQPGPPQAAPGFRPPATATVPVAPQPGALQPLAT